MRAQLRQALVLGTLSVVFCSSAFPKDTREEAAPAVTHAPAARTFRWLAFELGPTGHYQSTTSWFLSGSLAWTPRWARKFEPISGLGFYVEPRLQADLAKDGYLSSLVWNGALGADLRFPIGAQERVYFSIGGAAATSYQPASSAIAVYPQANGVIGIKLSDDRAGILGLVDRLFIRYGANFAPSFFHQFSIGVGVMR